MVICAVPSPPSGTGNVNIEEAEKLLKPYLKRYPKVGPPHPPAGTSPCPRVPCVPTQICVRVITGGHLPVLRRAD